MMHNHELYSNSLVKNKSIRTDLVLLLGGCLALASTAALVITLQTLVIGTAAKVIACLAGIALQGCLYLFAAHASYRVRLFSWVLLFLSVAMTTLFIENTWQSQQQLKNESVTRQHNNSVQAQQIRYEIGELNNQIASLLQTAQTDSDNGFRERSLATQKTIEALQAKRSQLSTNSLQLPTAITATPTVLEQSTGLRLSLFALIAVLIDLAAMIALSQPQSQPRPEKDKIQPEQDRPIKQPFVPELVTENLPVDPDYQKVVQAIQLGNVPPSKNQVRKQLNIGAGKVADYFSRMKQEGIVFQDNKGWYQLAV